MTLRVFSAMVLMAVLNVDAESLPYFDPLSSWWPSWSYGDGTISREQNEKLVLIFPQSPGNTAESVIALVNQPIKHVWKDVRALVAESIGILVEYHAAKGPIPEPKRRRPPYVGEEYGPWPEVGKGLSYLGMYLSFPTPEEHELTSLPYNQIGSIKGFSELRIRVIEGTGLLDKEVTIIEMRRRDYSREWARIGASVHLAIPLPYKEDRAFTVVTDTEVRLIEQLKSRSSGLAIRYFVPYPWRIQVSNEYSAEMRASMKEAVKYFETLERPK